MFENFQECPAHPEGHRFERQEIPSEFINGIEGESPVVVEQCKYCGCEAPRQIPVEAVVHSMDDAEFVVDPFDVYKPDELPPNKPARDTPQYMFRNRPVTPNTWLDLTRQQLDTYDLSDGTALLVDPETREYCYVFWDEAEQCSNPYPNHAEAVMTRLVYIMNI